MTYFIVGDIHGCDHTFNEILEHWDPDKEKLICVGDLIDRGNFSASVLMRSMQISTDHPQALFLKGNHEVEMIQHFRVGYNKMWVDHCGLETLEDLKQHNIDINILLSWMDSMPLKFEDDLLLVTHAGLADVTEPYNEHSRSSVVWNRSPLKNIGKLQVHGHTPLKSDRPLYDLHTNSWNIDTGAAYGFGLSGLKVGREGKVIDQIYIPTDPRDIS